MRGFAQGNAMAWRRAGLVLAVALLAGWALRADPPAGPAAPPADGYEADVLLHDGTRLDKARVTLTAVRLQDDDGTHEYPADRVLLLDLSNDAGRVSATVTKRNKSQERGTLLTPDVPLVVAGQPRTLPAAQVAQIRFRHPKDHSLLAVLVGLLTLTLLEIVLGVDNIVLLAIYVDKVEPGRQRAARLFGLGGALVTRLALLATLSWLVGLTRPLAFGFSARDLILFFGGLFLIYKAAKEVREKVQEHRAAVAAGDGPPGPPRKHANFWWTIVQLAAIDILFSLDSVITAVGLVDELWVMATAVILSVCIMLAAAKPIGDFVNRRPTVKVLALSFLVLIGALLVAEGLGQHLDKGYIYFAMGFAVSMELINARLR